MTVDTQSSNRVGRAPYPDAEVWTMKHAAGVIGVHYQTFRAMVKAGMLPVVRRQRADGSLSPRIGVRPRDVRRLIESWTERATG